MLSSRKWLSGVIVRVTVNSHTLSIPSNLVLWPAFSHIGKNPLYMSLKSNSCNLVIWDCLYQLISGFWTRRMSSGPRRTPTQMLFSMNYQLKVYMYNNKHDLWVGHQWCLAPKLLSWKEVALSLPSSKWFLRRKPHLICTGWPEITHTVSLWIGNVCFYL